MKYSGLSGAEVEASRRQWGENILTPPERTPAWRLLLNKFTEPLIIILLVALALSLVVAGWECWVQGEGRSVFLEPMGILIAVLLATVVGFLFEQNAGRKFELLNRASDESAVRVVREGNICEIARREVVVGDIIVLETGDEVVADGELLEAMALSVDESMLTGELVARKTTDHADFDPEATYASNMVMRGTLMVEGSGVMRVLSIGDSTEYGKVYRGAQIESGIKTPLNLQLGRLARLLSMLAYTVAGLLVVGRVVSFLTWSGGSEFDWLEFGEYMLSTVMIAVTLIVVAVPEGLPMSVTLSLALSMKRMLVTGNLVRHLHACETMGAATVICTDKTGTLTENRMTVAEVVILCDTAEPVDTLLTEAIAINSTAHLDLSDPEHPRPLGNPTEGALLMWLRAQGVDYLPVREGADIISRESFSTLRKYMSTTVGSGITYIKGAPEVILAMCEEVDGRAQIEAQLHTWQGHAMRTLALAFRCNGEPLTLLAIVAISDPVRKDVPAAVEACMNAGIDVKIVTGDTSVTAREIGRQIGLWSDSELECHHITGAEFAALTDDELTPRVAALKIMSRARPMDKERLVRLLQQQGAVVAVTGDGTNDAPALNIAHVGLSMGDGTAVAKQASDITILDNSFASITRAVMWGRSLYRNIRRFVLFQMTINIVACLVVLTGAFLGMAMPLTVTQMLWVNLIMDTFAAMALASLPPSSSVMADPPRPTTENIISRTMWRKIISTGVLFFVLLFGIMQWMRHDDITSLTQFRFSDFGGNLFNFSAGNLTTYEMSLFFTIFVMFQFWNMFNARAFGHRSSLRHLGHSRGFLLVLGIILVGQILIVSLGGEMFNCTPLSLLDWAIIVIVTFPIVLLSRVRRC